MSDHNFLFFCFLYLKISFNIKNLPTSFVFLALVKLEKIYNYKVNAFELLSKIL